MTIAERIRQHIQHGIPEGQPFKPSAFYALGLRPVIDQTLSRLARSGWITRVARGVYVRPQHNEWVGAVLPSPQAVAAAVAPEETLQVTGPEACRQLQLSTQSPTRPAFLTNGRTRTVPFGAAGIVLKHAAERKLALAGQRAGVALTALYYLGRKDTTPATLAHIRGRLHREEYEQLLGVRPLMPAWLATLFYTYERT